MQPATDLKVVLFEQAKISLLCAFTALNNALNEKYKDISTQLTMMQQQASHSQTDSMLVVKEMSFIVESLAHFTKEASNLNCIHDTLRRANRLVDSRENPFIRLLTENPSSKSLLTLSSSSTSSSSTSSSPTSLSSSPTSLSSSPTSLSVQPVDTDELIRDLGFTIAPKGAALSEQEPPKYIISQDIDQEENEGVFEKETTCYIRFIPEKQKINRQILHAMFNSFGPIRNIHVPYDKEKRQKKGFAFVDFIDHEHAEKAINALDNTMVENIPIYVRFLIRYNNKDNKENNNKDNTNDSNKKKRKADESDY